jgi:hypothetical protein
MEPESLVPYDYPAEPYSEVIPGLFQASAAHSPAEMLSMFDVLIDVGGRDRWEGDPIGGTASTRSTTSRSSPMRR